MFSWSPEDAVLFVLLAVAVFTDLMSRRIPNVLTFGFMGIAFLVEGFSGEITVALTGAGVAFVLGFLLWKMGGAIRAGDAKLLMAVGAVVGPLELVRIYLIVFLINIPLALFQLAISGRLGQFFSVIRTGLKRDSEVPKPVSAPFAPVIAAGVMLARLFPGFLDAW